MKGIGKTLLLIGATSDIGRATALIYAEAGWNVLLVGRRRAAVQREADDISVRTGASVLVHELDILATNRFEEFIGIVSPLPDTAVCVVGELGQQSRAEQELEHAATVMRTNFEGPALLLGLLAERFAERGSGTIVGISSVAGDRGRASNYVYGAAKAGLTAFLSGLRNRLSGSGVRVLTVKPGFVRTRMTDGMKLPPLLTAEPQEVAQKIFAAAEGGKGGDVVYVRGIWRPLMTVIRSIPEPIFKRLRL
ncbi:MULTISPECIES: SDR family oxidoreductase [Rhizobium]|uniref:SDR family oxidoreductase n=1 Tax=Rhizobium changzhiense TaxID=2692317 RepID=A0A7Z0UHR5_9HYPH|nr:MULTISPECIES: SDR family oxidoreductase [Rhizobium]MBA5800464.1 SDR family oxidoreductase [Rhizobium changzhiense]MCH4547403.1 SDR family oxidoreductase [Rhizobium changzhiense]MCW0019085.1 SDR family oxidoreductase [Rhizobium sp. BT-226]NNU48872.1 SDR family oxidoreductase [Rhizobium changzhiense]NZD66049.1 SDR family oxidoreductase [Rhizobium changzhiense]